MAVTFLQPASSTRAFTTVACFGGPGSGKTVSLAMLAIAVSRALHNSAPVAMFDPENASPFVAKMFEVEGVPLLVGHGRSFVEMREGLAEAVSVGACIYFIDNISAVFAELVEAQKFKLDLHGRNLPYPQREELKRHWEGWNREVEAAPLHGFFGGRLAFDWGDDVDAAGDPTHVKLGTKLRGDSDAGYEPNLLIEMEAIQQFARDKITKSRKGVIRHAMRITKDRCLTLNGLSFSFPDVNAYTPGAFEHVWKALQPHFAELSAQSEGAGVPAPARSSAELFSKPAGESVWAERLRRIALAVEDFKATSEILWPGSSEKQKACRAAALEAVYKVRSWTAVEAKSAEAVEAGALMLRQCELAVPREAEQQPPQSRAEVLEWVSAIERAQIEATVL